MSGEKPKTDEKPKRGGGPNPAVIMNSIQAMLSKVMPQLIDASDIVEKIGIAAEKMYRQLAETGLTEELVTKMVNRHLRTMYYLLIFQEMFENIAKSLTFTVSESKPAGTG
ncbi:MAG: hypothetical protein ACFFCO_07135 [Promethearchaeota archaeon]